MTVQTSGVHPTLGFQLDTTKAKGRPTLINCMRGTSSAKLKRWSSTLRNVHLIQINGESFSTISQVEQFATEERVNILQEIKYDEIFLDDDLDTPILHLLKKNKKSKGMVQFSRKQLQ